LKRLNIPTSKVSELFRAHGKIQIKNKIEDCPVCSGSGYIGQVGVFEVLTLDREARKLLSSGDLKAVLANARRNKMIYMQEAALSKVVSGDTTLEEVARVIASGSGGGKSRGSAPARKAS
jgi:type II secretory ATPase GspE/PulE/Tfp pilus assembly ATPase PilB-like protein